MKERVLRLLVLTTLLLLLGTATSASADAARKVTGSGWWWWIEGFRGWSSVDVHEVSPSGEAKGKAMAKEWYEPWGGWRRWQARAICVSFGEGFDGEPAATFVVQLDKVSGWTFPGGGEVGQYFKLWASDGGTPASEGDMLGVVVMGADEPPDCGYELPWNSWPLHGGNVVIHQ